MQSIGVSSKTQKKNGTFFFFKHREILFLRAPSLNASEKLKLFNFKKLYKPFK